nr:MAG TPA: hypothetical protein [Caudoviricetes sp.]
MNNFIKVIVDSNLGEYDCYININSIAYFTKGHSNCNCLIRLYNNSIISTTITMQEIKRLIEEKQQHKGE